MKWNVPNLLLIAGTGRNVGKTTLACKIIQHFSRDIDITGIKISPHFYQYVGETNIIVNSKNYILMEEITPLNNKDSSRMLKAGASKVYYMQASDYHLKRAVKDILHITGNQKPVVCESGELINYLIPGIFLMLTHSDVSCKKRLINHHKILVDTWLNFDEEEFNFNIDRLSFSNYSWHLSTD